jgi:hypothetical protein
MCFRWLLAVGALGATLVYAEDFSLSSSGIGPITVHTTLTYSGKGERLVVAADNDSGQIIPYVKLCVKAQIKGCLFEMWTTGPWLPGAEVDWDVSSVHHVSSLAHEVMIEALTAPAPKALEAPPPTPKPSAPPVPPQPDNIARPNPPAKAGLTNESILKLVKAGLGDDVILGMMSSQPGQYSVDSDGVIALKQAGVSDKVIAAMVGRGAAAVAQAATVSSAPFVLHDATAVRLRLSRNLTSADATTGDTIDFEVLEDVKIDDLTVIARGAKATGTITDAEHKKRMARGGKLDVTIDYVRLVDDEKIALRAMRENKGGGHTGAMTGGIVATALIVWPAAPFFLFMHGKDATMPKGTEITAYTDGEIKLDRQKFLARQADAR